MTDLKESRWNNTAAWEGRWFPCTTDKAITKTLYRTAPHWSKVPNRFPYPTDFFEDWLMYEIVCLLDMLDYLKYIYIYFFMKILIFSS